MDENTTNHDAVNENSTEAAAEGTSEAAGVLIYSTPVCQYCQAAKEFFKANDVAYNEINVAEDAEARQEMIEMTGQMGVPVIRIGNDVVVGFDEDKVKELLGM